MIQRLAYRYHRFLGIMIITIVCSGIIRIDFSRIHSEKTSQSSIKNELSSLKKASAWLNTHPLNAADLKGKVVLIQFGTYTCINWLRTLPYVRAWSEKYKEKGLEIIIVHTPEFSFEENMVNVNRAIKDMKIHIPIAVDNKKEIWNAFNNRYWPALYIIDARGRIQHHQFGEGNYDKSEKVIQQLLVEAGAKDIDDNLVSVQAEGIEAAPDLNNLGSPETYLGYERTENFASSRIVYDRRNDYSPPSTLMLNQWSLAGEWTIGEKSILLNKANGKIQFQFHARDVHIVMGPKVPGTPARFRIRIDGKPPGLMHGLDVDEFGNGTVSEQRLYQVVRQPSPISRHLFEIEFLDVGVEAFLFTFG